jgi:hypothetical protein
MAIGAGAKRILLKRDSASLGLLSRVDGRAIRLSDQYRNTPDEDEGKDHERSGHRSLLHACGATLGAIHV